MYASFLSNYIWKFLNNGGFLKILVSYIIYLLDHLNERNWFMTAIVWAASIYINFLSACKWSFEKPFCTLNCTFVHLCSGRFCLFFKKFFPFHQNQVELIYLIITFYYIGWHAELQDPLIVNYSKTTEQIFVIFLQNEAN